MNAVGSLPGQFEGGTVSFAGALPHVAHRPLSMMCWDRDTAQVAPSDLGNCEAGAAPPKESRLLAFGSERAPVITRLAPTAVQHQPLLTAATHNQQHFSAIQAVASQQRTVFFAGVPPVVAELDLLILFSQFGAVVSLNLFKPFNNSTTSKGCGLVVFSQRHEAARAISSLHCRFTWPKARSAMVVEWMDPHKQHRKAKTHLLMALRPPHLLSCSPIQPGSLQPSTMRH